MFFQDFSRNLRYSKQMPDQSIHFSIISSLIGYITSFFINNLVPRRVHGPWGYSIMVIGKRHHNLKIPFRARSVIGHYAECSCALWRKYSWGTLTFQSHRDHLLYRRRIVIQSKQFYVATFVCQATFRGLDIWTVLENVFEKEEKIWGRINGT
jgi:hypothetical protein